MTSMDRATIIFGEKKSVPIASFTNSHLKEIEESIADEIGPGFTLRESDVLRLVDEARHDVALQGGFVKVGVVQGNLVFRCKDKNSVSKSFRDLILVKSYASKKSIYQAGQAAVFSKRKEDSLHHQEAEASNLKERSVGAVSREVAESILAAAEDGAWFVREGTGNVTVISTRKGSSYVHKNITLFETLGLHQDKYLSPDRVDLLMQAAHAREPGVTPGPTTTVARAGRTTTVTQPQSRLLDPSKARALASFEGLFSKLSRANAGLKLKGKPAGTWLIRASDSMPGEFTWSYRVEKKTMHETIDSAKYDHFVEQARANAALQIKP